MKLKQVSTKIDAAYECKWN